MPPQKTVSGLLAKMGNRLVDAHKKHQGAAPEIGNAQLPAGIEGGIARLVDCRIGEYKEGDNKGQPFFMAAGIVVSPVEFDGVKIAGLRTQIGPEPLCDTKGAGKRKTFDDHFGWFRNQLLILGFDIDQLPNNDPHQLEQMILQGMASLKGDPQDPNTWTYFRFRTWKGSKQEIVQKANGWWVGNKGPYPSHEVAKASNPYAGQEPRITQEWNGRCDPPTTGEEDATAGMNDESSRAPVTTSTNGTPQGHPPTMASNPVQSFDDQGDIDSLVSRANDGEKEAQDRLQEMAEAKGWTPADVAHADSWDAVAGMTVTPKPQGEESSEEEATEETEEEAEEESIPEVDQVCGYCPKDKTTGQPVKEPVKCRIMEVDTEKRTVSLKNLQNGKTTYKGCSWDRLLWD